MNYNTCKMCRWWDNVGAKDEKWGDCNSLEMVDDIECDALESFHETFHAFGCIHWMQKP